MRPRSHPPSPFHTPAPLLRSLMYLSIGLDFFQVIAVFAETRVGWPPAMQELFRIFAAFNLNLETVKCVAEAAGGGLRSLLAAAGCREDTRSSPCAVWSPHSPSPPLRGAAWSARSRASRTRRSGRR
jgi:hypothetical protein